MGYFKNTTFRYVFLAAMCFVFYGNTIGNDYAFDDAVVITENQFTQKGLAGIPEIFANDTFRGSYDNLPTIQRYRPLSLATFAAEHQLFGNAAHVSHFDNIVLLVWLSLVLYAFLGKLFARNGGPTGRSPALEVPFLATLLFIAHPVHTETVANIKGRDELLALACGLSALLTLLRYLDTRRRRHLLGAFLLFSLALFSKENAITFLAIAPLSIHFYKKEKWTTYLRALSPLAMASLVFLGARSLALRTSTSGSASTLAPAIDILTEPFAYASTSQRIASAFYLFGRYLRLLVFPHPLTIDYHPFHVQTTNWTDIGVWLSVLLIASATVFALRGLKRRSVVAFGIWFFLVTFSVISNLPFSIGTFLAERFLFAPSLGFVIVVAWLLSAGLPLRSRYKGLLVLGLSLLCLVKTYGRNQAWKDDFTLFTTDAVTSANSIKANLAASVSYLLEAQKVRGAQVARQYRASALDHARRAVSLYEQHLNPEQLKASSYGDAVVLLGDCYGANEMADAALQVYAQVFPWFPNREHLVDAIDKTLNGSSDVDFKIKSYAELVRLDPDGFTFNYRLGYLYGKEKNDLTRSIQYLRKAVEVRPSEPLALEALSHAYKLASNFEQAAFYLEKLVAMRPGDASYVRKLLALYQLTGNQAKETALLERARAGSD
jgi:protein O-mannosyl-transferase